MEEIEVYTIHLDEHSLSRIIDALNFRSCQVYKEMADDIRRICADIQEEVANQQPKIIKY